MAMGAAIRRGGAPTRFKVRIAPAATARAPPREPDMINAVASMITPIVQRVAAVTERLLTASAANAAEMISPNDVYSAKALRLMKVASTADG